MPSHREGYAQKTPTSLGTGRHSRSDDEDPQGIHR